MKRLLPLLLLLLGPATVDAQEATLLALRDTVAHLPDPGARRKLLERAVREHPAAPWAHYALALAYAGEDPDAAAPAFRKQPGEQSWEHLRHALAADSSFLPAALALAELALCGNDTARLALARLALARAGGAGASPAAAVASARLELRLGDFESAASDAQNALADPAQGAAAQRALGIALLRIPRWLPEGARAYLEGAARGGAAASYYADALPLASPAEREDWRRAASDSARATWITGFWARRAVAAGLTVPDRLAEHFHRLAVADREHRVAWAPTPGAALRAGGGAGPESPYDDAGLVYLRYGSPDGVQRRGELRIWVYWRSGSAPLRFFFTGERFAEAIPLNPRALAATRMSPGVTATPYDAVIELLQEIGGEDAEVGQLRARVEEARTALLAPRPQSFGSRRRNPAAEVRDSVMTAPAGELTLIQSELSTLLRRRLLAALASEDARPSVDRALPFFYDLASFRGPAGRTDVIASLAIPGDLVPAFEYPDGRVLYAPRVHVAIAAPGATRAAFVDSAFQRFANRRLRPGEFLRIVVPLVADPAPVAAHRVGVTVITDSVVGQIYGGMTSIPDFSGDHLMLSDIVLAQAEPGAAWRRGGVALSFMPARHFPAHGAVKLFYEVYNLPPGSPFHTQVAIERERNGVWEKLQGVFEEAPGLRLDFDGLAPAEEARTVQQVHVIHPNLRPGRYRIVIGVRSPALGEEALRERRFELLP